jgi:hypothetical protein
MIDSGDRIYEIRMGIGATNHQTPQVVDPTVSREKFDRQIATFTNLAREHQRRGWWLLRAEFPEVVVAFVAPQVKPAPVLTGVLVDFTNYDAEPPSVRLVNPFTEEPYRLKDLPTNLKRRRVVDLPIMAGGPVVQQVADIPLMQGIDPDEIPLLCIPGVREYHLHPAHTGDSWFLHREKGEGTLFTILNVIYQYGVQPLNGYGIGIQVTGLNQAEPPQ